MSFSGAGVGAVATYLYLKYGNRVMDPSGQRSASTWDSLNTTEKLAAEICGLILGALGTRVLKEVKKAGGDKE